MENKQVSSHEFLVEWVRSAIVNIDRAIIEQCVFKKLDHEKIATGEIELIRQVVDGSGECKRIERYSIGKIKLLEVAWFKTGYRLIVEEKPSVIIKTPSMVDRQIMQMQQQQNVNKTLLKGK